ncbi:hypothetical protein OLMES_5111 [Oleiphilus messinensis]|uniref:Uncharacterized protein n=1 Tax=Oleiphilus messinensis TaxID=141451 RepID=A0A1Y0IHR2_9GAMM|nr:hypothetical protein [Oleiphilus messinensis]ARU59095.1 hypothetical protein OLMES_5111 [Oleiphilus messinensis]
MRLRFVMAVAFAALVLNGCSTRELQGSLTGSTAQRLVAHSVDDLITGLPASDFETLRYQKVAVQSHFFASKDIKTYADQRMAFELQNRFGVEVVDTAEQADQVLTVFYTSLATDLDNFGITLPLSYIPGLGENTYLNVITLEKFHGISELYYFLGKAGQQERGKTLQAVVKTDALGLPFITIPLSNVDRAE